MSWGWGVLTAVVVLVTVLGLLAIAVQASPLNPGDR